MDSKKKKALLITSCSLAVVGAALTAKTEAGDAFSYKNLGTGGAVRSNVIADECNPCRRCPAPEPQATPKPAPGAPSGSCDECKPCNRKPNAKGKVSATMKDRNGKMKDGNCGGNGKMKDGNCGGNGKMNNSNAKGKNGVKKNADKMDNGSKMSDGKCGPGTCG